MGITFKIDNHSFEIPMGTKRVLKDYLLKAGLPTGVNWQVRPVTQVRASAKTPRFRLRGIMTLANLVSVVIKPRGNDSAMEYHIVPPDGMTAQEIVEKLQQAVGGSSDELLPVVAEEGVEMNQQMTTKRTGREALEIMGVSEESNDLVGFEEPDISTRVLISTQREEDAQLYILALWEAHKSNWFSWNDARAVLQEHFPGAKLPVYGRAISSLVKKYGYCEYEGGTQGEPENRSRLRLTLKGRDVVERQPDKPKAKSVQVDLGGEDTISQTLLKLRTQLKEYDQEIEWLQKRREAVAGAISSLENIQ